MNTIVLYSSKSGNTSKIADEIASELNCQSLKISQTNSIPTIDLNNYDLIFIGTGIHFGNPNEEIVHYLKTLNLKQPLSFALFITWGGAGKTDQEVFVKIKAILTSKCQKLIEDYYKCYGGRLFTLLKRGHPNREDAITARNWARKIIDNM